MQKGMGSRADGIARRRRHYQIGLCRRCQSSERETQETYVCRQARLYRT